MQKLTLVLVPLWLLNLATGEITHGNGYPLPSHAKPGRGAWLAESEDYIYRESNHGDHLVAFDDPEKAAQRLTDWTNHRREQLATGYRDLQLLATEAGHVAAARLAAQKARGE